MGILLLIIVFITAKNCDNIFVLFLDFLSGLLEFEEKFEPHLNLMRVWTPLGVFLNFWWSLVTITVYIRVDPVHT